MIEMAQLCKLLSNDSDDVPDIAALGTERAEACTRMMVAAADVANAAQLLLLTTDASSAEGNRVYGERVAVAVAERARRHTFRAMESLAKRTTRP